MGTDGPAAPAWLTLDARADSVPRHRCHTSPSYTGLLKLNHTVQLIKVKGQCTTTCDCKFFIEAEEYKLVDMHISPYLTPIVVAPSYPAATVSKINNS